MLATRWLPFHRGLWEATGYLFVIATAVLVGVATARVASRWAGVTAGAAMLLVGPFALRPLMTLTNHVRDPFTAALLSAYLVFLTRRRSWPLAVAVGIVAGANAASDPLVWLAAVAPFAVAAALLALRLKSRGIAGHAAVALGVTVAAGVATSAIMHTLDFHVIKTTIALADVGDVGANVRHLARMIALLGGANYAFEPGYPRDPLRPLVAVLAFAAVATPIVAAVKALARRDEPARQAFVGYWAVATVLLCLSFVVTPNATALGPLSVTYLLALAPAAAVGAAVLGAGSRVAQVAVTVAVAVIGATNTAGIANGRASGLPPLALYEQQLLRVLETQHVTRGFAGYWDAQNLSWQTDMRLLVAPVTRCTPTELCPYNFTTIRSWYEPTRAPTFLLLDDSNRVINGAPPFVAHARARYRFGPLTVYVFDYDIARHIRVRRE